MELKHIQSMMYKNYAIKILIFTVGAFILQQIIPGFTELFMLNVFKIKSQPWMFFTAIFMHGGLAHIFLNMFALLIFGPLVERAVGSRKFLFLYLIGGVFGNIIGIFFYPQALGASGAIMAMLGTLIVLMPNLRVLIYGIIPMPLWMAGILWFLLDFFGSFTTSGIGHIVHIAGLVFGFGFGFFIKHKSRWYSNEGGFRGIKIQTSRAGRAKGNNVDDWIKRNI